MERLNRDEFANYIDLVIHSSVYTLLSEVEIDLLNQDFVVGDPLLVSALHNYENIRAHVESSFDRATRKIQ